MQDMFALSYQLRKQLNLQGVAWETVKQNLALLCVLPISVSKGKAGIFFSRGVCGSVIMSFHIFCFQALTLNANCEPWIIEFTWVLEW